MANARNRASNPKTRAKRVYRGRQSALDNKAPLVTSLQATNASNSRPNSQQSASSSTSPSSSTQLNSYGPSTSSSGQDSCNEAALNLAVSSTTRHKKINTSHTVTETDSPRKKLFPQKLWELIHENSFYSCIRWSQDGKSIFLKRDEFERNYLKSSANIFNTHKAISFVRQMNMYGFKKIDDNCYANENFIRGCEHLLPNMSRKSNPRPSNTQRNITPDTSRSESPSTADASSPSTYLAPSSDASLDVFTYNAPSPVSLHDSSDIESLDLSTRPEAQMPQTFMMPQLPNTELEVLSVSFFLTAISYLQANSIFNNDYCPLDLTTPKLAD